MKIHMMKKLILSILFLTPLVFLSSRPLQAQTATFTYQGSLKSGAAAANGLFDFQFDIYPSPGGGAPLATTTINGVQVTNGVFTVALNATAGLFDGAPKYLEIRVKPANGMTYETLTPRQLVTSAPYALWSQTAETAISANSAATAGSAMTANTATTAVNALQLGGVAANQFVLTGDARLSDARQPLPNSPNYIQNSNSQQPGANFNVSGDGTVGGTFSAQFVNSSFGYRLGGQTFLGAVATNSAFGLETGAANLGVRNTFAGYRAGASVNSNAFDNSFFGANAGRANTSGQANSFFGAGAGEQNTFGGFNAFFGYASGAANLNGNRNAFFGVTAGRDNTSGSDNTFVGSGAGQRNTTGELNTFVGAEAGVFNETGTQNSFFGYYSGRANTTGGFNSFFGATAGASNTTGLNNSFFGYQAGVLNTVGGFNAFFGYASGNLNSNGNRNAFFGVTAGRDNTSGSDNSFFGGASGQGNQTGESNAFFGSGAGITNTTGSSNSFFGSYAGQSNIAGNFNTLLGSSANVASGNLSFATAIGAGAVVSQSNTLVLGRPQDAVQVPGTLTASGTFGGTFSGSGTFSGTFNGSGAFSGTFSGSGANLTALNAANITTGALDPARLNNGAILNGTTPQASANFNISGGGTIGGTLSASLVNAQTQYNLGGNAFLRGDGNSNTSIGFQTGVGSNNNSFFGAGAGQGETNGSRNTAIGALSSVSNGLFNATAIGYRAAVTQANSLVLGSIFGVNNATADTLVGIGTTAPLARLDVRGRVFVGLTAAPDLLPVGAENAILFGTGDSNDKNSYRINASGNNLDIVARSGVGSAIPTFITFKTAPAGGGEIERVIINADGTVRLLVLGAAGATALCRNASNQISTCSSSIRYKNNVQNYTPGLDLVRRLRPVSFNWKADDQADFGLVAEEVAAIEPLLTTRNEKGETEGVKYDRVGVVLVNAVNEQQAEIEAQRTRLDAQAETIRRQQAEIEELKAAVCALAPGAKICAPQK